jgi:hypothetical protein
MAQMLAARGDVAGARGLLATARDRFARWGIPAWEGKAAGELAALEADGVAERNR